MVLQQLLPDFKTKIKKAISDALAEDIGSGDHTSLATIPARQLGQARLLIKEDGILAGVEAAKEVVRQVDKDLVFET
jgi:nicotinate-nucleotide pyrophosphorylase (carboxylating)